LLTAVPDAVLPPQHIALLTSKYWGRGGVHLTVGFLDNPAADLRARILSHMNAWAGPANVTFVETATDPQVRITRTAGQGYYSYLGTDILSRPANAETMNLDSFTMNTPDSEFYRVVRHETGHTLGFPHEHMRSQIVDRIDREKAIAYFMASQGWSRQEVIDQVLTPLANSALIATADADPTSIMCYWLPASIMKDGVAVVGGTNIDSLDAQFAGSVYPKLVRDVYLAWKGQDTDKRLFFNKSPNGQSWNDQTQVGGGTSHGPALAAFNERLHLAWKGQETDKRMFFNSSANGQAWTDQIQVGGGTSHGPALAAFNERLYLAWKGEETDKRMFFNSTGDGTIWTDQTQVGGGTSHGPTLAVFNGRLYLAWKGQETDKRMFFNSTGDAQTWTDQVQVGGGTSHGPSLAAFNGRLYLAWKGQETDKRMFICSSADGQTWTGQTQVGGGTSHGPSLAAFNGRLYLAWKGEETDPRMFYCSSADGQTWTDQIQVGGGTSERPALAGF
jgi:hypothetical protein